MDMITLILLPCRQGYHSMIVSRFELLYICHIGVPE